MEWKTFLVNLILRENVPYDNENVYSVSNDNNKAPADIKIVYFSKIEWPS